MFDPNGTDFVASGGLLIAIGDTTVEQTGMLPGELYQFTAIGGMALCRWGASDAAIADAGFDFAVPPGAVVRSRCPAATTAINVIESDAGSIATATLAVARVRNR